MDEGQVAQVIGRAVPTLQKDRVRGSGPRYIKIGRHVRYRPSDVTAWLEGRTHCSTSEYQSETAPGAPGEAAAE